MEDQSLRRKVAILSQGFIPLYRVKFFELLSQMSDIQYVVFHGSSPRNSGHRELTGTAPFPNYKVRNIELSLLARSVVYQPVLREILFGNYEAVILGHELKFISNLVLLFVFKLAGKPVIWWGHGFDQERETTRTTPRLFRVIEKIKIWLARSADMYLVYTDGGAEKLSQAGVPRENIATVRNTIDVEGQIALHERLWESSSAETRKKAGLKPDSLVLLYIGRLYKEKRVEELVGLVRQINSAKLCRRFVEAVIIGGGPELESLKQLGNDVPGIHFLGEIYDQEIVAKYMRISCALIIPGGVGLAVNHAFCHGLPVITRQHALHGPEAEYIESGKNGLVVGGGFDDFVRDTAYYLNSESLQRVMSKAALGAREKLTLNHMVVTFHGAIQEAINRKGRKEEGAIENAS